MAEPKFHQLHYNFVAKRLRTNYPTLDVVDLDAISLVKRQAAVHGGRRAVENIALDFADRFKADNPEFDYLKFLDQCSPDPDLHPFSELWEERYG